VVGDHQRRPNRALVLPVEGWSDPYGTWHHDAVIKVGAGVDVEVMLEQGARVLERAVAEVARTPEPSGVLTTAVAGLRDTHLRAEVRLAAGITQAVQREMAERPLRDFVTPSPEYPGSSRGSARCTGPGTRFSQVGGSDARRSHRPLDQQPPSPPPPNGSPRSRRWVSTSSTSRRFIR
jgi:hypothetical protein